MANDRFREKGQITGQNFGTGKAQFYSSLSDRLSEFADVVHKKHVDMAQVRGTEQGQEVELTRADGITQAPEKKSGWWGSEEKQAYNTAIGSAYVASIDTDILNGVNRIANENQDNLIGFNEAVSGFWKGVSENLDPAIKQEAFNSFRGKSGSARTQIQRRNMEKNKNIAKADIETSLTVYARQAGAAAYDGAPLLSAELIEKGDIATALMIALYPDEKDRLLENQRIAKRETLGQLYKRDIDEEFKKSKTKENIDKLSDKVPANFTGPEWEKFIEKENRSYAQKLRRYKLSIKVKKLTQAQKVAAVLDSGGTEEEIDSLILRQEWTDTQKTQARKINGQRNVPVETNNIAFSNLRLRIGTSKNKLEDETTPQYIDRITRVQNDITSKQADGELDLYSARTLNKELDTAVTQNMLEATNVSAVDDQGEFFGWFRGYEKFDSKQAHASFMDSTGGNEVAASKMFWDYSALEKAEAEQGWDSDKLRSLPGLDELQEIEKLRDKGSEEARKFLANQTILLQRTRKREIANGATAKYNTAKKQKTPTSTEQTESNFLKSINVTEEDITQDMKATGETREQVIQYLRDNA